MRVDGNIHDGFSVGGAPAECISLSADRTLRDRAAIRPVITIDCVRGDWRVDVKIAELFRVRRILELVTVCEPSQRRCGDILSALWSVQRAIYRLDDYGERTWNLSADYVMELWEGVDSAVARVEGSAALRAEFLHDLAAYRDIEIARRTGAEVTGTTLERFYFLKASDLRLARSLIAVSTGHRSSTRAQELWEMCEVLGEICDDLADINEDAGTYNANRVAIAASAAPLLDVVADYRECLWRLSRPLGSVRSDHCDEEEALVINSIIRNTATAVGGLDNLHIPTATLHMRSSESNVNTSTTQRITRRWQSYSCSGLGAT
jgi:hypothetical protein